MEKGEGVDRIENLNMLINEEKERFEMMKTQIEEKANLQLILKKCKCISIIARSKFLEKVILSSFEESQNQDNDIPPSDTSLSFGFNGILAMAIGEQQYTDELEKALASSLCEMRKKDEELMTLEEKYIEVIGSQPEELIELQLQNNDLKELCSILESQKNKLKNDIKDYKKIIISLEKNLDNLSDKLQLQKNINKNLEKRCNYFKEKQDRQKSEIKSYENLVRRTENDILLKQSTLDSSEIIEKLTTVIESLKDEKSKINEEAERAKSLLEEKYDSILHLFEKEKTKNDKITQQVKYYQKEILRLEEEMQKITEDHKDYVQKYQSEILEVISNLRCENKSLKRKIQEFVSKDLSNGSGECRPSLHDEIVEEDGNKKSFISAIDFQEVIHNKFISEECVIDLKDKLRKLEEDASSMRIEINEKDQLIASLKKEMSSGHQMKNRPSILLKIKPNPLVLRLFSKN